MITCSVCGQLNDELAVLCISCRGYLQSKVDNLDLFQTIWLLIEKPRVAFKRIVLAQHKNYVLLLSSLLGVALVFGNLWLWNLGAGFTNLLTLVGSGVVLGIPCGIVFVLALSSITSRAARSMGSNISVRNTMAVLSYSAVPLVLSLVFVFPLEIAIFGVDFFGKNPSPFVINPEVYLALLAFDGLAVLWAILLLYTGLHVLTGLKKAKSLALALIAGLMPGIASFGMSLLMNRDVH